MTLEEGKPGTNRPVWEAEQTHPELSDLLKKGLVKLLTLKLGITLSNLGLIRNVKIDDEGAIVKMILTTPFCPYGPAMIESTRQKAEQVWNYQSALISVWMPGTFL